MINKQILAQLCGKLEIGTRMAYKAINEKKAEYGYSVTNEIAAYILAADNNIDISKYLDRSELAEVREARKGFGLSTIQPKDIVNRKMGKVSTKSVMVSTGKKITSKYGFLTERTFNEAKEMAEKVYPAVYLFENSARELILNLMEKGYGPDWWETKVSSTIKNEVQSRIGKEKRERWHSKRGAHQIFYTDMGDLSLIITNNWDIFKQVFPGQSWVTQRFNEIELSRNIIAHNNALEKREINRINLYVEDWNKQISKII